MRRGLIVASAVLLLAATAAPAAATAVRERGPGGLTVLVRENDEAPVVAVSVLVRVGTRWERAEVAGITSLLQQVLVKGTTTRTAVALAEAAEELGGGLAASGDTDYAEVRGTALARHWQSLLDLIADVVLRPAVAEREIEGERRAILSAIRSRRDQPFPRALDTLMGRLYGPHPYGRPVLGHEETVTRLDRSALLEHHRRFYRAGRTIVSVSGQVPAREVVAHIARLFAAMPAGDGEVDRPAEPPAPAREALVVSHPAAQAQVLAGVLAPPIDHPDYAPVKVLTTVLGGGMSGRLFAALRDREGLAYSTGAFYPSRVGPSAVVAYLGTAPANAERAAQSLRREIARLAAEEVGSEDLARAKAYLLGQFALDRRTNARLAWYQAFFEAAGVGHEFAARYARAVEAVSPAEVARVARAYLVAPTLVLLRPPR